MVDSSDGGRSSESSDSSSTQRAARLTRAPGAPDIPAMPSDEPRQRAYIAEAVSGAGAPPERLAEPLEQRDRERIGLVAQARHVALGDLDPAGQLGAPGHQRRRAAGHQRDAA